MGGFKFYIMEYCEKVLQSKPMVWLSASDIAPEVSAIAKKDVSTIRVALHLRELSDRNRGKVQRHFIKDHGSKWMYAYVGSD